MKRFIAVALFSLATASAAGPAQQPAAAPARPQASSLDELLNQVRNARAEQQARNKAREQEFLRQRDQQRALLNAARNEQEIEDATSRRLQQSFDQNERQLTELNESLRTRMGNLGEVFGVVRQVAADTKGVVENSIVSAEYPGRGELASKLAQSKALPSIQELEQLWYTLQQEMTESGKVVRFPATIIQVDGTQTQADVLRVGVFNAYAEDRFLRYLPETSSLVELSRQPAGRYLGMAQDLFEGEGDELIEFGLDPTRGQLLGLLVEAPSFWERVDQGQAVGYITLLLGLVGLLVAAERLLYLWGANRRIREQLASSGKPSPDNALGRILSIYADNKNDDVETIELKLDEAIMREVPQLEARIGFLKLVAALGPLLGLLGTVTGMIATFQSITLFGTGDPKLMAGGISQALVTTVEGLCVAIPMVLLHGFVSGRSKALVQILEEQTAGIIAAHAEKRK